VGETTKKAWAPRIAGVVTGSNRQDPQAWESLARCQVAELRADTFAAPDLPDMPALLRDFRAEAGRRLGRVPEILLTLRLRRDGGAWPDEGAARRAGIWEQVARAGRPNPCDWVDIEVEEADGVPVALREALGEAGVRVLVSHHDFRGARPLAELRDILGRMLSARPEGIKFALTCGGGSELDDCLALAREVAAATPNGAVFSMGGPGRATRVVSPLLGCPLTYGYLTGGPVAPGQLSVPELADFFARAASDPDLPRPEADTRTLLSWAEDRLQEAGLAR
jgi:3-dehydroquinate dehydratase-1